MSNHHLTDAEVRQRHDDHEFMKRPHMWATDNMIFLRTRTRGSDAQPRNGVLFFFPNHGYCFAPDVNMHDMEATVNPETMREGGTELLSQLIDEGWYVD